MTYYDKRLLGARTGSRSALQSMLRGARRINLWQTLPDPKLGSVADDWKRVGEDIREAMTAEEQREQ